MTTRALEIGWGVDLQRLCVGGGDLVTIDAAQVAARALAEGDISSQGLAAYQQRAEQILHRRLARSHRLRERFSPDQRASRGFVRLFAVAAGGK